MSCRIRLFGTDLVSDIRLHGGRPSGDPFSLTVRHAPELFDISAADVPVELTVDGRQVRFGHSSRGVILQFGVRLIVRISQSSIEYHRAASVEAAELEDVLVGPAFAVWLEARARRVLHGGAVAVGPNLGVGFLGHSGAGKSSLVAAFIRQGCSVLSDEQVVLDVERRPFAVIPGIPWVGAGRVMRDELASTLPPVSHPRQGVRKQRLGIPAAAVAPAPVDLAGLVVLDRTPGAQLTWARLTGGDALISLVAYSYVPRSVLRMGLQQKRMEDLARVAEEVPIYRLTYPSGFGLLADVCSAIQAKFS